MWKFVHFPLHDISHIVHTRQGSVSIQQDSDNYRSVHTGTAHLLGHVAQAGDDGGAQKRKSSR